ncbi:MAG: hypothetical protein JWP10_773, partial [Nocardioidaceae bacterium]|nr:hypothetical protein [Nocardioidaceae bacterium]
MSGVAEGFGVIAIIIAVGFVLAHYGVLDAISQKALAGVVFYVAIPALLIDILSKSEITSELGKAFGVAVLSVLGVLAIWVPVARLFRGASVGHTVIGGMGASYVNGGNLGIPIAVYVIGDATMVIPIMLMQLIAYAPVALALLGSAESNERASVGSVALSGIRSPLA